MTDLTLLTLSFIHMLNRKKKLRQKDSHMFKINNESKHFLQQLN